MEESGRVPSYEKKMFSFLPHSHLQHGQAFSSSHHIIPPRLLIISFNETMSNVNGGNADYGEDTTVNPGPWLILATTLFCILLMILLFLCLVNFGRRYKKYQAPFDEDTPAAPTQDSDEEENDEYGGDEVSVDKELGVRIMTPSVEEQCSKSEDEGLSSYKPSYRSDNDIDSSISQSKESTKSTSSFAQKPIHALFDRLLVPPYPDDNESESNLGTSDRSGKLVARLNDVMDTRADI